MNARVSVEQLLPRLDHSHLDHLEEEAPVPAANAGGSHQPDGGLGAHTR